MKKLNYFFCLFVFALSILNINVANATSGTCSYHGGVSCSAGADTDGSVICNDGWTNSSVLYSSMSECRSSRSCPIYLSQEEYDKKKQEIENSINQAETSNQTSCQTILNSAEGRNEQSYQSCLSNNQSYLGTMARIGAYGTGASINTVNCEDIKLKQTELNKSNYNTCLYGSSKTISIYRELLACLIVDHTDYCKLKNPTTHAQGNNCVCNDGYQLNSTKTSCELISNLPVNNLFAKSLSESLRNLPKEATTTKKVQVVKVIPKQKNTEVSKFKKMIEVVATTTMISTTTQPTILSTGTPSVIQNKVKTKWYTSFLSRFMKF